MTRAGGTPMFTENDLRDALQHSAARADALLPERPASVVAAPRRRRWAAPLVTAACVLAVAGGAAVALRPADRGGVNDQGAAAVHTSASLAGIGDRLHSDRPDVRYYLSAAGDDTVTRSISGATVTAFAVRALPTFVESTIRTWQPVGVGGQSGYYGRAYPWTYTPRGTSGARRPATVSAIHGWNLAVPESDGSWVFAYLDRRDRAGLVTGEHVNDRPGLVAHYEALALTLVPDATSIPVRVGHLPPGLAVTLVRSDRNATTVALTRPGVALTIEVGEPGSLHVVGLPPDVGVGSMAEVYGSIGAADTHGSIAPTAGDVSLASAQRDGLAVHVDGVNLSEPEVRRVLETLTVHRDPSRWFTLREALG